MVNSNPETVSTDYDTSDKLYFEPLTLEDTGLFLKPDFLRKLSSRLLLSNFVILFCYILFKEKR